MSFKNIKELEAIEKGHIFEIADIDIWSYKQALKDVLGLMKTNKTKEEIIKEIEG